MSNNDEDRRVQFALRLSTLEDRIQTLERQNSNYSRQDAYETLVDGNGSRKHAAESLPHLEHITLRQSELFAAGFNKARIAYDEYVDTLLTLSEQHLRLLDAAGRDMARVAAVAEHVTLCFSDGARTAVALSDGATMFRPIEQATELLGELRVILASRNASLDIADAPTDHAASPSQGADQRNLADTIFAEVRDTMRHIVGAISTTRAEHERRLFRAVADQAGRICSAVATIVSTEMPSRIIPSVVDSRRRLRVRLASALDTLLIPVDEIITQTGQGGEMARALREASRHATAKIDATFNVTPKPAPPRAADEAARPTRQEGAAKRTRDFTVSAPTRPEEHAGVHSPERRSTGGALVSQRSSGVLPPQRSSSGLAAASGSPRPSVKPVAPTHRPELVVRPMPPTADGGESDDSDDPCESPKRANIFNLFGMIG